METCLTATQPYSLERSAQAPSCPTRRMRGGIFGVALDTPAGPALGRVWQRPDGTLSIWLDAPAPHVALDALRHVLALDVDLRPFYGSVANDPTLGPITRRHRGLRPLRLGSVPHALLRGVAGQLVRSSEARRIELAAVRRVGRPHAGLHLPLTAGELRSLSPAALRAAGLAEPRARTLVRVAALDVDGMVSRPTAEVVRVLTAVPGIGPWTAAVVCMQGLGRLDHGLVGDLGLLRLVARDTGRVPAVEETAELLGRYAPFQALASLYLLRGAAAAGLPAGVPEVARAFARIAR